MRFLPQDRVLRLWLLGAALIIAGIVLHAVVRTARYDVIVAGHVQLKIEASWQTTLWNAIAGAERKGRLLLLGLGALGLRYWRLGFRVRRALRAEWEATDEVERKAPVRRERPRRSVLPAPPRLGNDPFRDPPRPPAIVVVRHEAAPAPAPVVPGEPNDKPEILT